MIVPFAVALLAAQPTTLAEDSGCILAGLSPSDRVALSQSARDGSDAPQPLQHRLEALGRSCAQQLSWTPDRAAAGSALAVAIVIRDDAAGTLSANGFDRAPLDAWFEGQSDAFRIAPAISDEDAQRAVVELNAAGTPMELLEANASLIGAYMAARAMIERLERGLPLE